MSDDDGIRRNGALEPDDDDDDAPLDADEVATGSERAGEPVPESLAEVVARVIDDLGGVERRSAVLGREELVVGGRMFAVLHGDALEVGLHGPVARAALATDDTQPSSHGPGWVRFAPRTMDRFAADRAEAWLRFAHRRAGERQDA